MISPCCISLDIGSANCRAAIAALGECFDLEHPTTESHPDAKEYRSCIETVSPYHAGLNARTDHQETISMKAVPALDRWDLAHSLTGGLEQSQVEALKHELESAFVRVLADMLRKAFEICRAKDLEPRGLGITVPLIWDDATVQDNYLRLVNRALAQLSSSIPVKIIYEHEAIQHAMHDSSKLWKEGDISLYSLISVGGSTTDIVQMFATTRDKKRAFYSYRFTCIPGGMEVFKDCLKKCIQSKTEGDVPGFMAAYRAKRRDVKPESKLVLHHPTTDERLIISAEEVDACYRSAIEDVLSGLDKFLCEVDKNGTLLAFGGSLRDEHILSSLSDVVKKRGWTLVNLNSEVSVLELQFSERTMLVARGAAKCMLGTLRNSKEALKQFHDAGAGYGLQIIPGGRQDPICLMKKGESTGTHEVTVPRGAELRIIGDPFHEPTSDTCCISLQRAYNFVTGIHRPTGVYGVTLSRYENGIKFVLTNEKAMTEETFYFAEEYDIGCNLALHSPEEVPGILDNTIEVAAATRYSMLWHGSGSPKASKVESVCRFNSNPNWRVRFRGQDVYALEVIGDSKDAKLICDANVVRLCIGPSCWKLELVNDKLSLTKETGETGRDSRKRASKAPPSSVAKVPPGKAREMGREIRIVSKKPRLTGPEKGTMISGRTSNVSITNL